MSPLVVEQDGLVGWAIKGNPPVRGVTPLNKQQQGQVLKLHFGDEWSLTCCKS